jgi:hypothetical protein
MLGEKAGSKMAQGKIGFVPNPPNRETREKVFGEVTVVYTKERKSSDAIAYNCECRRGNSSSATGFVTDRKELSWEEIEEIPRFKELVSSYVPAGE